MIAACILFNSCLAHRAQRHIVFVFVGPTCQLLLHCFFTGFFPVPVVFALEAKLSRALIARHLFCVLVFSLHVVSAVGLGAPSHQWIQVKFFLAFEFA